MEPVAKLVQRKREILEEMAQLGPMRRGTVTEQFFESRGKDGVPSKRGPYPILTSKEKGKTVSRRLRKNEDVALCQEQIEAFRRFQKLSAELVDVGQQLADLALAGLADEKKTSLRSSKRKSRAN